MDIDGYRLNVKYVGDCLELRDATATKKGQDAAFQNSSRIKKSAILNTAQDPSNDACSHAREGASQPDMLLLRTDKAIEDRSGRLMLCTL